MFEPSGLDCPLEEGREGSQGVPACASRQSFDDGGYLPAGERRCFVLIERAQKADVLFQRSSPDVVLAGGCELLYEGTHCLDLRSESQKVQTA
jgi:hypothetical protein